MKSAYLLAILEPVEGGCETKVKGFDVFSQERPEEWIAHVKDGVPVTVHVTHGNSHAHAFAAMASYVRERMPWIWSRLPEDTQGELVTARTIASKKVIGETC